jgi:hypothetical protein
MVEQNKANQELLIELLTGLYLVRHEKRPFSEIFIKGYC